MIAWSNSQQIALAVLPKFSSIFSLFGSAWIFIEVACSKSKRAHPYHRMLFAMSSYDIFESIGNFLSTWPIPKEGHGEDQKWAIGNTATCTAQGFFLTIAVAVPIYNAFLALYYMLVVNYNVSDRSLRTIVEPTIHGIAFFWAFGTGIASAALGLFNDANLWCWIAPFPAGCSNNGEDDGTLVCERGVNFFIYRWVFYFGPLWFCIFSATLCTMFVYRRVKRLDERTLRYRRPETVVSVGNIANSARRRSTIGPLWNPPVPSSELEPTGSTLVDPSAEISASSSAEELQPKRQRPSLLSFGSSRRQARFNLAEEERRDDMFLSGSSEIVHIGGASLLQQWRLNREIYREDYARSVQVARQALIYLGAFYLTHIWSTSTRIMQQLNLGETSYFLILMHSWFDPFQGFLNFLVYQRPRFLKIRAAHTNLSRYESVLRTLRFSHLPDVLVTSSGESVSRFTASKSSIRAKHSEEATSSNAEASDPETDHVSFASLARKVDFRLCGTDVNGYQDPIVAARARELSTILECSFRSSRSTIELIQNNMFAEAQDEFQSEFRLRMATFEEDRVDL